MCPTSRFSTPQTTCFCSNLSSACRLSANGAIPDAEGLQQPGNMTAMYHQGTRPLAISFYMHMCSRAPTRKPPCRFP